MATVEIHTQEHRYAHYGLYRTILGGTERVTVRRKVGEKTDYMHNSSRRVQQQRERLGTASSQWNKLTPTQKNYWRTHPGFVLRDAGKTETVLLIGRQLFIAQDIYSLAATGKLLTIPYELCIVLCDEEYYPLNGGLSLLYYEAEEWHSCPGQQIGIGQWLYSGVPRGKEFYRVEGWAPAHYDPKLPEHQWMTEEYLLTYRYHVLLFDLELLIQEPWTVREEPPELERILLEPWHLTYVQPEWEAVIIEPWTS